jgi:hypothetical protein
VSVRLIAQNVGESVAAVVATTTSDAAGHWVLNAPQGPSRKLTIGTQTPTPDSGVSISQSVKPKLTLRIRALGRARLRFSGRLEIAPLGTAAGRHPGAHPPKQMASPWLGRARHTVRAVQMTYQGPRAKAPRGIVGGSYSFRAVAPSTRSFLTATSPITRTRVR